MLSVSLCGVGPENPCRITLSPCGPARGGLGRPRILLAGSGRMPVGGLGLGPRGGPGTAASEAGQGSRSGHEFSPYGLASEDAGERKERCRPPRQSAHLGVPGPESGRIPATAALAGPGGHAPPGGKPERPQQGASQAEPSLGASPADRPRTVLMWSKIRQECYAARVFRPNST